MNSPASILMFGRDVQLMKVRSWVLETGDYRVDNVISLEELEHELLRVQPSLLILCYTLTQHECERAQQIAKSRAPGMPILALATGMSACPPVPGTDEFNILDGPGRLVSTVKALSQQPLSQQSGSERKENTCPSSRAA